MKNINEIRQAIIESVMPPPAMSVSEWADTFRVLPRESSEPGRWRTERVPYMREVMNAFHTSGR